MCPTELELEVFRAGDYGDKGRWSEADVAQIAGDYDPAVHEAPVTLDHAQSGPAWGWVRGLRAAGPVLMATLGQVSGELKEWLAGGRFKKRSIELYPALPATGRPYLRAVSFLGAAVPEAKGLADPLFSDDSAEAVRLPFIDERDPDQSPAFAEAERLRGEVRRLEREAGLREIEAACHALEREGRLLPAWREAGIVAFMESLRGAESDSILNDLTSNRFDERNDTSSLPHSPYQWFIRFLRSLPPAVPMAEASPAFGVAFEPAPPPPGVPMSARVDPASLERHRRASALLAASPTLTYAEALLQSCASTE